MKINVIRSGSRGNCTLIELDDKILMIDCGVSLKHVKEYLAEGSTIHFLFITHEHSDHLKHLDKLLETYKVNLNFLTDGTFTHVKSCFPDIIGSFITIKHDMPIYLNLIKIFPIQTNHDASEPIGLVVINNNDKLTYITDTGYIDDIYYPLFVDSNAYLIESNYDDYLTRSSNRPKYLNQRNFENHLSNKSTISILNNVVKTKKAFFIPMHISDDCNNKEVFFEEFNNSCKVKEKLHVSLSSQKKNISIDSKELENE